jgi:glycosyltransferase involved in cell wall biosynthesis
MARVSVVLPTANSRDALLATVESILDQEYSDFELLVADDGSTDGTGLEFLARFGPDPSRAERVWRDSLREDLGTRSVRMLRDAVLIHYLHQVTPRGPGAARNRAIGVASGEFLAFAEPGDIWKPRKLSCVIGLLDARPEFGGCLENQAARKKKTARRSPELSVIDFCETLECPGLRLNGALLRRSCLDSEAPFDENLPVCEEYDFWLRVATRHTFARTEESHQTSAPRAQSSDWGLARFRVYALEKAYQGGHLSPTMRHRVAEELIRQCDFLVEGYRERENLERANFYDRKKKRFAQEVAKLDVSDPVFSGVRGVRTRLSNAPA